VLKFAVRRWTHSLSPSPAIRGDLASDCDRDQTKLWDAGRGASC
jgi:hypothetical protein